MANLWYIDPPFLSDALLTRQHQSLHGILHGIVTGRPRRGVTRFLNFGGFIAWAHYLTVMETNSRGFRHESPINDLWLQIPPKRRRYDYPVTSEMVRRDKSIIMTKMSASTGHESQFRSTLPIHLAKLEFIEKLRAVIQAGTLPPFALVM